MQAFVPKTRRPKFELHMKIIDLNNVPLVNGISFVKWHLPHSNAAEHRGRTEKCPIKDHKVIYDYHKRLPVRITIDKNSMLQELYINFEIVQEYGGTGRGERITLGNVRLNLAEYIEPSEQEVDAEEGVVRRYLMQDSKINSTVKIGIYMRQTEGDRNYVAPPLKTAPVFGGIAGIISADADNTPVDDNSSTLIGTAPSISLKSKETGELQDMYRRTLAAYWAAQPGELKADDAIEDIFSGGDGWGDKHTSYTKSPRLRAVNWKDGGESSENEKLGHGRNGSTGFGRSPVRKPGSRDGHRKGGDTGPTGRASLEQQASHMKAEVERRRQRPTHEVEEIDIREDLRSWRLG
ncbi:hypothetical protein EJ05DRAFT_500615 [Pseudovirgaria hyperparasitica]|uniref:C2 NT-type domain-containing protein n=1 Tax=Pseudovirgaria hyperparasitica TaxID=470096 RepID=A0A6A6W931_9PEZI|nr:uncharacterized protein EJ05DRAFT_500615 [Pseudovirgaria hyperparasitica]KAF2758097.1 hypothetical protein EJ05DRAFT_500615 [Pseudovirgaria hyperparasitica]